MTDKTHLKRSNKQLAKHAKVKTEPDRTKIVKITERIDILSVLGQSTRVGQGSDSRQEKERSWKD